MFVNPFYLMFDRHNSHKYAYVEYVRIVFPFLLYIVEILNFTAYLRFTTFKPEFYIMYAQGIFGDFFISIHFHFIYALKCESKVYINHFINHNKAKRCATFGDFWGFFHFHLFPF